MSLMIIVLLCFRIKCCHDLSANDEAVRSAIVDSENDVKATLDNMR